MVERPTRDRHSECPLHACVAPRGIVSGHPHDQAAYLGAHTVSVGVRVRVRPFPHNELPMPPHDRVGGDDARDLIQELPA